MEILRYIISLLLWISSLTIGGDEMIATRYGEQFNGLPLGCAGTGDYSSNDPTIIAVGYPVQSKYPCYSKLLVCAEPQSREDLYHGGVWRFKRDRFGTLHSVWCIVGERKDTCGACGSAFVDLSEEGIRILCGYQCDRIKVYVDEYKVRSETSSP